MSQLNTTILSDLQHLTKDEITDEYEKLSKEYVRLKTINENGIQQIYELKRSLQTATNAESYLAAELEAISAVHADEIKELLSKHSIDNSEWRASHSLLMEQNQQLEAEVGELTRQIDGLKCDLNAKTTVDVNKSLNTTGFLELERKQGALECENIELVNEIDELQGQFKAAQIQNIHHETTIEDLKEKLECVESTLQSKQDEAKENLELFEASQERIFQLTSELATYKTEPDTQNTKGNSLFAEVDDQRQKMKHQLTSMKEHYLQMKKEYNESQNEIRRLKRENAAMHKELQICSDLFLNADRNYELKLNERINALINEIVGLKEQLKMTETNLITLSNSKDVTWLDSMLTYCKKETDKFKSLLYTCRLQKSMTEENLRNSQQEVATWRFEALKSRCIIINRECLLSENKIPFNAELSNIRDLVKTIDTNNVKPNIGLTMKKRRSYIHLLDNKENVPPTTPIKRNDKLIHNVLTEGNVKLSQSSVVKQEMNSIKDIKEEIVLPIKSENLISPPCIIPTTPIIEKPDDSIQSTFLPTYRSITHTPQTIASLHENMKRFTVKPSNPIVAKLFPKMTTPNNCIMMTTSEPTSSTTKKYVNFSDSTLFNDSHDCSGMVNRPDDGSKIVAPQLITLKPTSKFVKRVVTLKSKKHSN